MLLLDWSHRIPIWKSFTFRILMSSFYCLLDPSVITQKSYAVLVLSSLYFPFYFLTLWCSSFIVLGAQRGLEIWKLSTKYHSVDLRKKWKILLEPNWGLWHRNTILESSKNWSFFICVCVCVCVFKAWLYFKWSITDSYKIQICKYKVVGHSDSSQD